ncbi:MULTISPECIES: MFS transporter [unclassified Aeromicrobium]|uniref:MFS transporter n=1 Tax=unclassified Aeromicrobium TaxID=2633570 RepID=UPI002096D303|nr:MULTISPECIES: MFS transporter [unclassified Aeromicrobium]MCO7238915.1 MFS transporter [Aeromicrobium sp. CnD17-E]MDR6119643.1 MFS family permease [Aeromicrobium sp. SORGH_AS_0981]
MAEPGDTGTVRLASRTLLGLAAVAIAFAAADTYVVVLALPDMMSASGLDVDELQRAAPIVSGFLLGYVGVLPLIGRISDLRGRVPVLLGSLVVFAVGSLVTAAAYDLETIVAGRLLQGVGGGGLIPPTLALVADLWPPKRRGLPLGVVGAVQELGSVLGPLYGAVVLAFGSWRDIFWLNAAVGLLLAAVMLRLRDAAPASEDGAAADRGRPDLLGAGLLALSLLGLSLVMLEPQRLVTGVTSGLAFLPVTGDSRWLTPVALVTYALAALLLLRQATARRPLVQWRTWGEVARSTDLVGAGLLTLALAAVIVTFASAEPESGAISPAAPWLLPVAAVAAAGFAYRQRTAATPLVPRGALAARPAWGALVVSFVIGASLIAALVDIPFFARLTVYRDSQLDAALVLVRFLVALPVGAVLGGWLLRRVPAAWITAAAMLMSALAFLHMATWDAQSLASGWETLSLVAAGLGFGLAIAPVNAVLLEHTGDAVHGVASALLIVARMVGMLIGISALTTVGLRAFYAASEKIPPASEVCSGAVQLCRAYRDEVRDAGIAQLHAVFVGAAVCAAVAAILALWLLREAPNRRARNTGGRMPV